MPPLGPAPGRTPSKPQVSCVQEDLCVLVPDEAGRLLFVAGSVSFPSRWRLRDKIGLPMAAVHGPVAHYAAQLARPVDAGLDRLTPERGVWRVNWNLLDDPSLFQLGGHSRPEVNDAITADNAGDSMWLRVERQTFRRFPVHRSVLFTIRTLQRPLAMVAARADLAGRMASGAAGVAAGDRSVQERRRLARCRARLPRRPQLTRPPQATLTLHGSSRRCGDRRDRRAQAERKFTGSGGSPSSSGPTSPRSRSPTPASSPPR